MISSAIACRASLAPVVGALPARRPSSRRQYYPASPRKVVARANDATPREQQSAPHRRDLLLGGAAAAGLPLLWTENANAEAAVKVMGVEQLGAIQKNEMKSQMYKRCLDVLKETLVPEDAPACMRLVLLDAGSYDVKAKTGGMNGSVIIGDELSGEDKKALGDIIQKLKAAKKEIDDRTVAFGAGQGPIGWADLLALAAKVAVQKEWVRTKVDRAADPAAGLQIANQFGAPFEVKLGRVDAAGADNAPPVPGMDASVEEIKGWLNKLGNRNPDASPGPFTPKAPFWERPGYLIWTAAQLDPKAAESKLASADPVFAEFKAKYDKSKQTVTRTDFEVDFIDYFNRLTSYATFDELAYCYPLEIKLKL
mmetsp:Transcript_40122/g.72016  ORF Transcript_40122/g.72016 Transcript_40122/m.72016 type:complete len:367 (-) Transcript_40122:181-1281(-)|eukprot:CAMPEP_0177759932 /NCGR_PEP_ID=MMETSP0491_2-20121128/4995_1 /TAXON_ID=63592 /ORGANISM="Tetraselmis chuii, Strain PLY429" /LENGTH=366 /DNA_ID=CAMNT_0019275793 /DNA_START=83 /DNA_END=1183 /DNA_ORIENTATION=-